MTRKKTPAKPEKPRLDNTIVVAIIGLVGTFITALFASPVLIAWINRTPTPTAAPSAPPPTDTPTFIASSTSPAIMPLVMETPTPSEPCPGEMIYVKAGYFRMGGQDYDPDAQNDEKPPRDVFLSAFCIDKYEVSNSRYAQVVGDHKYSSEAGDLPVAEVTWYEAAAFCEHFGFSLPTEAQWEKAARGGDGRIYPWGNDWNPAKSNNGVTDPRRVRSVESYSNDSELGIYNAAGNVAEWVSDWYDPAWYSVMPETDPFRETEPLDGNREKVIRGGSYTDTKEWLRTSAREKGAPDEVSPYIGFRCVALPRFP